MMIRPSLMEMEAYQKDESLRLLPVIKEILSDFITPITALSILKNISQNVFLLESMEDREKWGRYTFLGYDPKQSISCKNGIVESSGLKLPTKDPKALIRQILAEHKAPRYPGLLPLQEGWLDTLPMTLFSMRRTAFIFPERMRRISKTWT